MNITHLHPMLVHFPIALALTALLFDLGAYYFKKEWFNKTAISLTVLATLGAITALLSGFFLTKPVAGLAAVLKEEHTLYAVISTCLLIISSLIGLIALLKQKDQIRLKYAFTVSLILVAIGISLTGMIGGSIVYDVWLF